MKILRPLKKYLRIYCKRTIAGSYGFLEYFTARDRANIANRFILDKHRNGRVLDLGCGSYPIFLLTTKFKEKFGIDKKCVPKPSMLQRLKLITYDIEKNSNKFPFSDDFIDVITMLAVFEHIEYSKLSRLMSEAYRILKPGGIFILTTPATWSDFIIRIMGAVKMASRVEMKDHKTNLKNSEIREFFRKANFKDIKTGYFELFFNRWFLARK